MQVVIHKPTFSVSKLALALAWLAVFMLPIISPPTVHAATQVYAVACSGKKNHVQISGNKFTCVNAPKKVTLQGIGSEKESSKPYPDKVELTLVVASCKSGSPKDPRLGSVVKSIGCSSGSATLRKQNVEPNPIPAAKNPSISAYYVEKGKTKGGKDISGGATSGCGKDNEKCKDPAADPEEECNLENGCDLIDKYINPAINLLSFIFGLIAVISIIMGGIQYAASTGDPQKVTAAKDRIRNTIIAVAAYFFLYGFLQFLIPGGIFNR